MNDKNGHFRTIVAVLVLLTRKNASGNTEYLLQKRQNTGFADGMWDFSVSGHVEKDEPMSKAVHREAKEEIGVDVDPDDIKFIGLLHSFGDGEPRVLGCFEVMNYSGEIGIGEPEKVAELEWFDENNLPENMIGSRKVVIEQFKNQGVFYWEYGW